PRREEQRPAAERRAGAVPHGDPAAELPRAATTASSLPARRAELTALEKHTLAVHRRSGAANRTDASTADDRSPGVILSCGWRAQRAHRSASAPAADQPPASADASCSG